MTTTDTTTNDPLTISDVLALNTIIEAATTGAHVRWLADDSGNLCHGVARCLAHDGGGFLNMNEDVRDGFLHVSGIGEQWLPIRALIVKVKQGEFGIDR